MANLRQERLTPGGFEQSPARRGRRWPWVAGLAALCLVALAWFDGGEEPLRPIAEDVTLPESEQGQGQ
ncbi:MAG: hypothetical protein NBV68_15335 [Erythrobacter sp.]|uniref:hypothetical protein n=1 Tax=Erythrobacter sp. TaxID=1042 RepID=UPI0025F4E99E|nr:hypothetical protein [Erythrobacter sp.]MCM0000750.1 hypothetical protein [Erythrobacter sp.]